MKKIITALKPERKKRLWRWRRHTRNKKKKMRKIFNYAAYYYKTQI
jgi:hypothetical protein